MPVKRTRTKRRLDELNLNQKGHLLSAHCFFSLGGGDEFDDAEHRRDAWARYGEAILAEERLPGRRPAAFWDYERAWPAGAVSEAHALHLLPGTSERERAEIEADWRQAIYVVLINVTKSDAARSHAARWTGVPPQFFDEHAPRIAADLALERAKFVCQLNRPAEPTMGIEGAAR